MQRLFTSGSRQAPDPYDQFLEQHSFYRKHTARDSSCLFRVISEQMYDTQKHHLEIRKKCVLYMRKHRNFFATLVDRDIDEYLDDMSKPKTHGSLVELEALAYIYQRRVILFEPYNLGKEKFTRPHFFQEFLVFYSPERHFDSVFTCDYIKDAAVCQSICYEILYKDLFKLPDVNYAVEKMLHADVAERQFEYDEHDYAVRVYLDDGRCFNLDMPEETNCILENFKLCHFHYEHFPYFANELQPESLLPEKHVSCVRQLLHEGITPFPYKVAKALDPNMYRNIEFDAWNEARKELRMQNWYNGDNNFKVGAKCHVKLPKSGNDLYTCHIQEISIDKGCCLVFIEQLGEKRMVPYESLSPLPPEQFKPWSLPYRLQRHSLRLTRHYNYNLKFSGQFSSVHDYCGSNTAASMKGDNWDEYTGGSVVADEHDIIGGKPHHHYHHRHHAAYNTTASLTHKANCFYKLNQYTQLDNFHPPAIELCAMPLTVESNSAATDTQAPESNTAQVVQNAESTAEASDNNNEACCADGAEATTTPKPPANETQSKADSNQPMSTVPVTAHTLSSEDVLASGMEQLVIDPSMSLGVSASMPCAASYVPEIGYCYYQPYTPGYYANAFDDYYAMPPGVAAGAGFYDYPVHGGTVYYMYPQQAAGAGYSFAASNNMYYPSAAAIPQTPTVAAMHALPTPSQIFGTPSSAAAMGAVQVPVHSFGSSPISCNSATCYPGAPPSAHYGTLPGPPALITANPTGSSASHHYSPASYNTPATTRGRIAGGGGVLSASHPGCMSITPLNGRINWEAKKSVKANGVDLPSDMATLRYFYNLGLEYHSQQMHRKDAQNTDNNSGGDYVKTDENFNQHDTHKSDANNNNAPNLNTQSPSTGTGGGNTNYNSGSNYNKNHYVRRFNARYGGNGKERSGGNAPSSRYAGGANNTNMGSQQSGGLGGGQYGSGGHGMLSRQQQTSHDYNNNTTKGSNYGHNKAGGGNYNNPNAGTTPNSSRHGALHSGGNSSSAGGNAQGGRSALSHAHNAEHLSVSSPSAGASGEPNTQNSYNSAQHPPPYEHVGDGPRGGALLQTSGGMHATPAMQTAGGGGSGIFLPMGPPPPQPFGLYTNAPPPSLAGAASYQQPPPPYGALAAQPAQFQQMPPPAGGLLPPPTLHVQHGGAGAAAYYAQSNGSEASDAAGGLLSMGGGVEQSASYTRMSYPPPPLPPPSAAATQQNGGVSYYYAPPPHGGIPNTSAQYYWNASHASTAATQHGGNAAPPAAAAAPVAAQTNSDFPNAAANNRTFGQQNESANAAPSNTAASNTNSGGTNAAAAAATTTNSSAANAAPPQSSSGTITIAKRIQSNKATNN